MKLPLREISTIELPIVYLSCLEMLERLEKGQNGFLMMCGQGYQNIGILQVNGANVLQQKKNRASKTGETLHTGGSITTYEHALRMVNTLTICICHI